jgi:hypothetical protein
MDDRGGADAVAPHSGFMQRGVDLSRGNSHGVTSNQTQKPLQRSAVTVASSDAHATPWLSARSPRLRLLQLAGHVEVPAECR